MKVYKFEADINGEKIYPKGVYYQGKKYIILVGCTVKDHTIRRKELIEDVFGPASNIMQKPVIFLKCKCHFLNR